MPPENFYFHKIFKGESEEIKRRNAIEKRDLHRLIEMLMSYDRYYIKEGQMAPQYTIVEERKLLTEGIENSIDKIAYEVYKSN